MGFNNKKSVKFILIITFKYEKITIIKIMEEK